MWYSLLYIEKLSKTYNSVMIEGGCKVITSLLDNYKNLIDIVLITISPKFVL